MIGEEGGVCNDVLLTLRFYSQKPFFVTALPAGTARAESPAGSVADEDIEAVPAERVRLERKSTVPMRLLLLKFNLYSNDNKGEI
ncbi:hypothetical protein CSV75_07915 [Sporosarcina sp. P18a]|nr:hypothetical protein CSV75_07915 [Sporosarcina sp. P18a]